MKKNFNKKLLLKKHTVANLNAEQLKALQGGLGYEDTVANCYADHSVGYYCGGGTFGCSVRCDTGGNGDPKPTTDPNTH
jgi:hypothetical protein